MEGRSLSRRGGKKISIKYAECISVFLVIQHAMDIRHIHGIILFFVASLAAPHFSALSHKRHDFRENRYGHEMCFYFLSTTFI